MANLNLPSPTAQQSDVVAALQTAVQAVPVTPPVVVVTPLAPASTTQTYAVVAKIGTQTVPGTATITTGAATLSAAASNNISWNTIPGAVYDVYRTAGGSTQGKIASNLPGVTLNIYGGPQATLQSVSLVDTGLSADGSTVPGFNTSGTLAHGLVEPVQVLAANGAISLVTGNVVITKGSVAAITLPQPIAGSAQSGGQDGASLTVTTTTAYAHTITTAASGINGTLHIATFTAGAGNSVTFTAYNGEWYATTLSGVAIS
jgi:hypothetical protein